MPRTASRRKRLNSAMATVSCYTLVIILLFVALISDINCQSTVADESCGSSGDGLRLVARQQKDIINKLDVIAKSCQPSVSSLSGSTHVDALKCKYLYFIFIVVCSIVECPYPQIFWAFGAIFLR